MGRKKSDPKQRLLTPNMRLRSPLKAKENLRTTKSSKKEKPLAKTKKRTSKRLDAKKESPVKCLIKNRGRPKPQAKASAKLRSSPVEEIQLDAESQKHKQDSNITNNNNNEKASSLSPTNNNNNNNVIIKTPPLSSKNDSIDKDQEIEEPPPVQKPEGSTSPKEVVASNKVAPSKQRESENSNKVKCKVCKQWFPNRYFQRKHMLMEHEDQLYECRVCSFNSVDPEKLKSHIIKVHVTKKEKSESVSLDSLQEELEKLIDKKVPRKVMMEDGVTLGRDGNSKMRYVCALCSKIYTSKYSLERHVRCHTLEKPYHCDVCDFTSSYREHMMRHMTSVHLIVHSNVPKVKYVPKKKRDKESEDEQSDDNASITAAEDSASAKKRRNILRERFECAVCGLRATHKTDLVDHIRTKHPNAHIESLENNDGSKVHLIVTMAKKPRPTKKLTIQCSYCFLIFHDTWKYKVHLRSHTGVKPFQCNLCDMKATSKMTIRDHIHRKHKNATDAKILLRTVSIDGSVEEVELPVPWREFKCEFCNDQFTDNYNLKMHKQKQHKDALPFFCLICSHKEVTKAGMIIHCSTNHKNDSLDNIIMRNGKPCKIGPVNLPSCDFCKKIFSYRSQLNIHLKVHTGERSFSCYHCDYKTNFKKYLETHVHKVHFGRENPSEPTKKKRGPKSPKKQANEEAGDQVELGEKNGSVESI